MISKSITNITNYGIHQRTYRGAMRGLWEVFFSQQWRGLLCLFDAKKQMEKY